MNEELESFMRPSAKHEGVHDENERGNGVILRFFGCELFNVLFCTR